MWIQNFEDIFSNAERNKSTASFHISHVMPPPLNLALLVCCSSLVYRPSHVKMLPYWDVTTFHTLEERATIKTFPYQLIWMTRFSQAYHYLVTEEIFIGVMQVSLGFSHRCWATLGCRLCFPLTRGACGESIWVIHALISYHIPRKFLHASPK